MLVLTRKLKESIAIGNDIKITVLAIKGTQVQLGIEAPTHIKVYREEIYAKIVAENRQAAMSLQTDLAVMNSLLATVPAARRE